MTLPASGPISLNNVNVELGLAGTTPINMDQASVRTLFGKPSGVISMSDGYGKSNITVPTGLIVPLYNTATVPSGWSSFASADGKMIVGAGVSYGVNTSGGSTSATVSGTLSSSGAHTVTSSGGNSAAGTETSSTISEGAHTHTFSAGVTVTDAYKTFKLIKAGAGQSKLPTNAILFGSTSLSGLSNIETSTNRLLMANTTYGATGGSSNPTGSATTSSNGSHRHGTRSDGGEGQTLARYGGTVGAHTHSLTINMTLNTKRAILSAWTNASASFDLTANGIAMWESATPPDGWFICDGANGTLDLRDYFLYVGTTASHGTRTGNNSASWSISQAAFSTAHNHQTETVDASPSSSSHGNYAWSHSHSASSSQTITQPYFALYFIQFGG